MTGRTSMDNGESAKTLSYLKQSNREFFSKSNTWTSTSMKNHAYNMNIENLKEINIITATDLDAFTIPIESRIKLYEQRFNTCMNKESDLSNWIKTVQAKGPPSLLNEGYIPPSRSRLPDNLNFSSRAKRNTLIFNDHFAPSTKSSLSTLFKKATDTLSTSYKKPLKHQNRSADMTSLNKLMFNNHPRFSFSTSLSRFSLSKNNNKTDISKQNKRFSIAASSSLLLKNSSQKHEAMSSSTINKINLSSYPPKKKPTSSSSILPNSSSSVFLDKLRSRAPHHEAKECLTIQSNTKVIGSPITDDETPPTSPSSIDSSSPRNSSHHFMHDQEISPNNSKHLSHRTTQMQDKDAITKKKYTSLFITPSLSATRILPQKSNFLKRSSMLA